MSNFGSCSSHTGSIMAVTTISTAPYHISLGVGGRSLVWFGLHVLARSYRNAPSHGGSSSGFARRTWWCGRSCYVQLRVRCSTRGHWCVLRQRSGTASSTQPSSIMWWMRLRRRLMCMISKRSPSKLTILIDHNSPLFVPTNSSTMLRSGTVVVAWSLVESLALMPDSLEDSTTSDRFEIGQSIAPIFIFKDAEKAKRTTRFWLGYSSRSLDEKKASDPYGATYETNDRVRCPNQTQNGWREYRFWWEGKTGKKITYQPKKS